MDKTQERSVKDQLLKKMQDEYQHFMETLKEMDKQTILHSAYEQVYKREILDVIHCDALSQSDMQILLREENPLSLCYMTWLKSEDDPQALIAAIQWGASRIQKHQQESEAPKRRNSEVPKEGGRTR